MYSQYGAGGNGSLLEGVLILLDFLSVALSCIAVPQCHRPSPGHSGCDMGPSDLPHEARVVLTGPGLCRRQVWEGAQGSRLAAGGPRQP